MLTNAQIEEQANKKKYVERHLSPLLYELNPIYTSARYLVSPCGNEHIIVNVGDGSIRDIDITAESLSFATMDVLEYLFRTT